MNILCKGGNCSMGFTICCHQCKEKMGCDFACEDDCNTCNLAEGIVDELVQFESAVPAAIQVVTDLIRQKKELEDREKEVKATLLKAMETYGVKSFDNGFIKMTYVAPTTKTSIDSVKLKKAHPELVAQFTKTSNVSAYVKVELKGGDK